MSKKVTAKRNKDKKSNEVRTLDYYYFYEETSNEDDPQILSKDDLKDLGVDFEN